MIKKMVLVLLIVSLFCGVTSAYYNTETQEVIVDESTMQMFDKVLPGGVYFTGNIWLFDNGGRTTYGATFPAVDVPRPCPALTPTLKPIGGI